MSEIDDIMHDLFEGNAIVEDEQKLIKSALKLQEIFKQDLIDWKSSSEMIPECGTSIINKEKVKAIYSVLKSMKEKSEK